MVTGKRREAHSGERGLSSVYFEPAEEMLKWLNDGWVARLSNPANFDKVEDQLRWDYGMDISTTYLGDDMILILGLTDERVEQLMNEVGHSTLPLFYSLQKWSPSLRPGYRLAWVHCWGIPILAWEVAAIKKILGVMGEVLEIDEEVEERRWMDRARVLLKTPWKPSIQHTVVVHIGSEVHEVQILEERGPNVDLRQGTTWTGAMSSEEIDSNGSFMESPTSDKSQARIEIATRDEEEQPNGVVRDIGWLGYTVGESQS